jgi:hypothetical protein
MRFTDNLGLFPDRLSCLLREGVNEWLAQLLLEKQQRRRCKKRRIKKIALYLSPVSRVSAVVEYPVKCGIETVVGAGEHPEQLLPPEVHFARRIRINPEPEEKEAKSENNERFIEDQAFLPLYDWPLSPPRPRLPSASLTTETQEDCAGILEHSTYGC